MKYCPLTYEPLTPNEQAYSSRGLRALNTRLTHLLPIDLSAVEQRQLSMVQAGKMAIPGVQSKLSARLNVTKGQFMCVDQGGMFIIKPPSDFYAEVPENEDLTMRLAATVGLDLPWHGLVYGKDGALSYVIERFDRQGRGNQKVAVEDFAQLLGATRATKYNSSMEHVANAIDALCTFPAVERVKLFRVVLFSFLVGNEDMHLKNLSLITTGGQVRLAPMYDLLSTTLIMGPSAQEEMALSIRGKRTKLTREDMIDHFAYGHLKLPVKVVDKVLEQFANAVADLWPDLIARSFLTEATKRRYMELIHTRIARM